MSFTLRYHQQVVRKDIPALPKKEREHIQNAIQEKLTTQPEIFGKPLQHTLRGYRRLRVGDYRIIFRIEGKEVNIFSINHRSGVYKDFKGRLK